MICPKCMTSNENNSTVCRRCGAKLEGIEIPRVEDLETPKAANTPERIDSSKIIVQSNDIASAALLYAEINKKSPFVGFILSILFPGLGQLYAHAYVSALIWFSPVIISIYLWYTDRILEFVGATSFIFYGWGIAAFFSGITAAFSVSSRNKNLIHSFLRKHAHQNNM